MKLHPPLEMIEFAREIKGEMTTVFLLYDTGIEDEFTCVNRNEMKFSGDDRRKIAVWEDDGEEYSGQREELMQGT